MKVRIILPWALYLSANDRLNWVGDRLRLTRKARKIISDIQLMARNQSPGRSPADHFGERVVQASFWIYQPDRRRRDAPNVVKAILDALEGVMYEDDLQVAVGGWKGWPFLDPDPDSPRIEVVLEDVEGAQK